MAIGSSEAVTAAPFRDLETKGFLVLRGFLSAEETKIFADDYDEGVRRDAIDYGTTVQVLERPVSTAIVDAIRPKIDAMLAQIAADTTLRGDTIVKVYYFAADVFTYSWHQDMDFWAQDRRNLFNFYIPIRKPDPHKTNLCVVPHDTLARASRGRLEFAGFGGRTLTKRGETTEVMDVGEGKRFVLDADIEALAETPSLSEGDLMLMRGDVVHRTQDADTKRVAVSIRVARADSVIRRARLVAGASSKRRVMRGLLDEYGTILRCFEALRRDEITIGELVAFAAQRPSTPVTLEEMNAMLERAKSS